tara:strand:+ start:3987 stop:4502 length:516 start_codon:yes stop_codon:yes gene_type:complete
MLQINEIYTLDIHEQKIVELVAEMRQSNKEKTGWDGSGRVAEFGGVNLNVFGFGAEYIFCREKNTFPDFEIKNTSKRQKTDDYDCNWLSMSVDVKTSQKQFPLMVPKFNKCDVDLFAFFVCEKYPNYQFKGYATNEMLFQDSNLRQTRVMAYCLDQNKLVNEDELLFLKNL